MGERAFSAQRGEMVDEASQLFDSFSRDYTSGLLPLILELYDCQDRSVAQTVGRGRQVVNNAYFSILGATTPGAMGDYLKADIHWRNGLWARFGIITPMVSVPEWHFLSKHVPIPSQLSDSLRHLAFEVLKKPMVTDDDGKINVEVQPPIEIRLDKQVEISWEAYAKVLSHDFLIGNDVDEKLHASYGRYHTSAIKIATLLSVSDWACAPKRSDKPMITPEHWFRAQAITELWRANTHKILEDNSDYSQSHENKILKILLRGGSEGLTIREIGQFAHLPREMVERQIYPLVEDGLVIRRTYPSQRSARFVVGSKV